MNDQDQVCCPKFEAAPWDQKILEWIDKKFIKDKVFTLFYLPINFGSVMQGLSQITEKAGATIQDGMWLSEHTSKWNMNLYLAVDRDVPDVENTTLSGKFLSKVYQGSFKETGNWMKDFENYAKSQGVIVNKTYLWYTTCPKCAQKYGQNYVVIIGKIN